MRKPFDWKSWVVLVFMGVRLSEGAAQVTVNGLTDATVYVDSVQFTIVADAGFDCRAILDAVEVPLSEPVFVEAPDFHELTVFATNQLSKELSTREIRFIVSASERGESEWGLPPWTPYPVIPSAADEFAGGSLELVVPQAYPVGLEIPIIARVWRADGSPLRANGTVLAEGQNSVVLRRGVGSGFLEPADAGGRVEYAGRVGDLISIRGVTIEPTTPWTTVAGELSGAVDWPEASRVALDATVTVTSNSVLRIGAGSVIRLGAGVDLRIDGTLVVNGTIERPVVFTPAVRSAPWGGFMVRGAGARVEAHGTVFTGSGANARWFDENAGYAVHRREQALFLVDGAEVALTNCFAIDHHGQFGHGANARLTLERCLVQKFITGGEYNGGAVGIFRSALIEFPEDSAAFDDADNDAIYFTTGTHEVRDTLIGWAKDDGIDHGSGGAGTMVVSNCWVEACFHEACAWSGEGRVVSMRDTVCLNNGQGIEAGYSTGSDSPLVHADHCLSLGNLSGARFGDNYDWTYNGRLELTHSFLLFNNRDVFGYNWADWTYREAQMDVRGNWLTRANPHHPENAVWAPGDDGWRLAPFMGTPADAPVGVGIALRSSQPRLEELAQGVPIGLSHFSTNAVTVLYAIDSPGATLSAGTLGFAPGETVKFAPLNLELGDGAALLRFRITGVEGGKLTGPSLVWLLAEPVPAEREWLVPAGAEWFFLDDGSDQGDAWTGLDFDHSAWGHGPAELGYGDAAAGRPEATVIRFGPSASDKHITYYFRHPFVVNDPAAYALLSLGLKRDDGAVVYLNGQRILTSNLPAGPVDYLTRATLAADDGAEFHAADVAASFLQPGANVLAVEIHQESPGSSDVSFDLELEANRLPTLQMIAFGNEWYLYWSTPGFELESAESLDGSWSASGLASPAAVTTDTRERYYRLRTLASP